MNRSRFTILLLSLNILLFVAVYLFEDSSSGLFTGGSRGLNLFQGYISQINGIELSGQGVGLNRRLEKTNDGWYIVSPMRWPANDFAVQRIITQLQFLEREASFSVSEILKSGHSLKDYGLEEPKFVLTLSTPKKDITFKIGDPTVVGNRIYILSDKGDTIFVMNKELMESLSVNIEDLRSQNIFDIPLFEVRSIMLNFEAQNTKVRLVEQNQSWSFETPIHARASKRAVERALSQLTATRVLSFVPDNTISEDDMGLVHPAMQITLFAHNRKQTLLLGKESKNEAGEAFYYAKMSGIQTAFTVPVSQFDMLKNAQTALRDSQLLAVSMEKLNEIEISQENQKVRLHREEGGKWRVNVKESDGQIKAYEADSTLISELSKSIEDLQVLEYVSDVPTMADLDKMGFTKPQREITLGFGDSTKTLLIGDFDLKNNLVYAKIMEENSVYEISRSILNLTPVRALHYKNRVLSYWSNAARIESLKIEDEFSKSILYEGKIDLKTQTWEEFLKTDSGVKRDALLAMISDLKTFKVQDYLTSYFSKEAIIDEQTQYPWRYKVTFTVFLPGTANNEQVDTIEYFFSERVGGALQVGGSKKDDVTFLLTQPMIDALFVLTLDKSSFFRESKTP